MRRSAVDRRIQGLFAVVVVWISAGVCLPMINVLRDTVTPEQLLAVRGLLPAAFVLFVFRYELFEIDRYTLAIGITIPFASLGLFKGVREWGANPTLIVIAATPVVNFFFSFLQRKSVRRQEVIGFLGIMVGVVVAMWGRYPLNEGCLWAVFGTVMNGILYEFFARAKSDKWCRYFWASLGIGLLGLVTSLDHSWRPIFLKEWMAAVIAAFAFVHGFVYWIGNIVAFEKLPKDAASVLVQGETPAVIVMAWVLLGEKLAPYQWAGVVLSLVGASYLMVWLGREEPRAT